MSNAITKKKLRIVLDAEAAQAFESMVNILKAETPTIKIYPSQFVSFLVADFLFCLTNFFLGFVNDLVSFSF